MTLMGLMELLQKSETQSVLYNFFYIMYMYSLQVKND